MNKLEELSKAFKQVASVEYEFMGAVLHPDDAVKLCLQDGTYEMPDGTFRTVRTVHRSEIEGEGVAHE